MSPYWADWVTRGSSAAALITSVAALIAAIAAWRRAGRNGKGGQ